VKRMLVLLLVTGSLSAPAVAAANTSFLPPISPSTAPARTQYVAITAVAPAPEASISTSSQGFAWGDAAIGAAVALAGCGAATVLMRRHRFAHVGRVG
jgi:hypothetical protein